MRALKDEMRAVRVGPVGQPAAGGDPHRPADGGRPDRALSPQRHPNVRVSILSRTSVEILAGIESLELDAGITYLDNEPLGRVAQVPLYTEFYRFLLRPGVARLPIARAGHLGRAGGRAAVPSDRGHAEPPHREPASGRGRARGGADGRIELDHRAGGACADRALGLGGADEAGARCSPATGGCVAIPIVEPEAEHLVGLIAARRDPQTPVLQALVDEAAVGRLFR